MRIIVIGAGHTGMQLSRTLVGDGHRVTLIDSDAERVREAAAQLDCAVVHAEGNSPEVLEKAGISSADALVAVAASDEVNMVTCALANVAYPMLLKIARVRNHAYYPTVGTANPFGIDWMVNPDVEVAKVSSRMLAQRAVGAILELGSGFGLVTLVLGEASPLNGLPLRRLNEIPGWHYLVAFVNDTENCGMLPDGDTTLHTGGKVGFLARMDEIPALAALCDAASGRNVRILVAGAGRIASLILSSQLRDCERRIGDSLIGCWRSRFKADVVVVDESQERCQAIARGFRNVKVLCGDALDAALIREEGLNRYDVVVAASPNYDRNLITAAYYKSRGVARSVALTANGDVADMAMRLGVDVAVPMRETLVDSILSHLYGHNVYSVHTVCGGALAIVDCVVAPESRIAGHRLDELAFGGSAVVLLVQGSGTPDGSAPGGDTVLEPGARVVLITHADNFDAVREIVE